MAKLDPTKFRVSSALKTIIGKELITNDFIAVFELVKNSFDAHSKRVDVIFEDIYGDNPCLTIWDNGKGMDLKDIVEKWLFVAYSAKKEGVEDYRDKIHSKRIHAGSKGIGRFSCDKLGTNLTVYTKKMGSGSNANKLIVDWTRFEEDSKKEFITIPVDYSVVQDVPYKGFNHGTILEITGLREKWDRSELIKLKHSLEKLINPNQENDPHSFSIYLQVEEELKNDKEKESKGESWHVVNGKVENKIFENLEIKTTKIDSIISQNGETITTRLEDRGTLIYQVIEQNPYSEHLKDIQSHLFVLNRSAKATFTRMMGIRSVKYGSVFLYKNGFRIYPFGEPDQDTLGIDNRKQQGTQRFFGTRDIIGRIEINGPNDYFQETSSRDGGLIRNIAYEKLEEYFKNYILKRLEKFTVGVIKWGNDGDLLDHEKLSPAEMKKKVSNIVYNLTRSEGLVDIDYDPKLIDILKDRTKGSLKKILGNLQRIAEQSDSQIVAKEIRKAQGQYKSLLEAKEEAEKGEKAAKDEIKAAKEVVKQKETQNLFLQSVLSQDRKDILSFHHHIGIAADTIEGQINNLSRKIVKKDISTDKILLYLQKINYQVKMISSISKFATKANFNLEATLIREDLIGFIREHLLNVCADILKFTRKRTKINYSQVSGETLTCKFKPIEITVILDNLISNSRKADASIVNVEIRKISNDSIEMSFSDNGKGILAKNVNNIFEAGFSTTDGSGLGLSHLKDILRKNGGSIKYNAESEKGTEFIIRIMGEA